MTRTSKMAKWAKFAKKRAEHWGDVELMAIAPKRKAWRQPLLRCDCCKRLARRWACRVKCCRCVVEKVNGIGK